VRGVPSPIDVLPLPFPTVTSRSQFFSSKKRPRKASRKARSARTSLFFSRTSLFFYVLKDNVKKVREGEIDKARGPHENPEKDYSGR
jgi:hypothetical protein